MNEHTAYAAGLRALADWIEANPEIPTPGLDIMNCFMNTAEEAGQVLRALKPCTKRYSQDMFTIARNFGPLEYRFLFYREQVCVKRVVGKKQVAEKIYPAHEEEIVEWDCMPVLRQAEEHEVQGEPEQIAE